MMKQLSTSRPACRSDSPGTEESSGLFCVLAHPRWRPVTGCAEAEFFADVCGALVNASKSTTGRVERDGHDVAVVHFR